MFYDHPYGYYTAYSVQCLEDENFGFPGPKLAFDIKKDSMHRPWPGVR